MIRPTNVLVLPCVLQQILLVKIFHLFLAAVLVAGCSKSPVTSTPIPGISADAGGVRAVMVLNSNIVAALAHTPRNPDELRKAAKGNPNALLIALPDYAAAAAAVDVSGCPVQFQTVWRGYVYTLKKPGQVTDADIATAVMHPEPVQVAGRRLASPASNPLLRPLWALRIAAADCGVTEWSR